MAVTIALHVAVVVALIAGLHVARTIPQKELEVTIETLKKTKPVLEPPRPLQFAHPQQTFVVPPPLVIQTVPPPPTAPTASLSKAVAAPPSVVPSPAASGESRDTFLARLLAQLNRYKRYPAEARKAHVEGVVMLHFVMEPNGTVRSFEISKSSGRPVLDSEALSLIQRAQPLPALPAGMDKLDAVVPIEFSLES